MFNFTKIYDKINWRNKPDKTTPIDATNLGKIDTALNTIDDRVVGLGNKANSVDKTLGNADISAIGDGTVKGSISTLNSNLQDMRYLDYEKKQLVTTSFIAEKDGIICGYINIGSSGNGYYQINIENLPIYFATSSGQSLPINILINKGQNVIVNSNNCEVSAYFVPFCN